MAGSITRSAANDPSSAMSMCCRVIRQWLSVSQPTAEIRKAAILQLVGKWKDDPDVEKILEDAMRRRGRQPGSDGTYAGYRPADEGDA